MVRIVTFNGDQTKNQKRFELLYGALLLGGGTGKPRGIEVMRREAKILDLLDSISRPNPEPTASKLGDEPARLVAPNSTISFTICEHTLLKERLEAAPWLPRVAREVVDAVDWLANAAEQDA